MQAPTRLLDAQYEIIDNETKLNELIADIKAKGVSIFIVLTCCKFVCLNTTMSIPKMHEHVLIGVSLSVDEKKGYYIPFIHAKPEETEPTFTWSIEKVKSHRLAQIIKEQVFENASILKIGHNIKEHIKRLHPYNIKCTCKHCINNVVNNFDDVMVMSYVLNCGKHNHDLETLIAEVLHVNTDEALIPEKEILGIGKKKVTFAKANLTGTTMFSCQDADNVLRIYGVLKPLLDASPRLFKFYSAIELPLVSTLASIELNGVKLDKKSLETMQVEYETKIIALRNTIKEEAGSDLDGVLEEDQDELNINSNRQLGRILFDKLKLADKSKKSQKSGDYIVDNETLDLLAKTHPIAKHLLEYRAMTKLCRTYIVGLQQHINPYTSRVHTTFQNALTVTGRLSSVSPNLQNIPSRTKEGKQIRKYFVAPEGHKIIKADYSQVELRILSHIAHIDVLRSAFREGKDVHSITASQVFNVPVEKVDKDLRRKAKAINFGIIYGMSEFGLAKQISVSTKEAKEYIVSILMIFLTRIRNYILSNILVSTSTWKVPRNFVAKMDLSIHLYELHPFIICIVW